jgi:hypothetical protein
MNDRTLDDAYEAIADALGIPLVHVPVAEVERLRARADAEAQLTAFVAPDRGREAAERASEAEAADRAWPEFARQYGFSGSAEPEPDETDALWNDFKAHYL